MGESETSTLTTYDANVVGAGPDGSTAALALARRGARVALSTRRGCREYKPYGSCLLKIDRILRTRLSSAG